MALEEVDVTDCAEDDDKLRKIFMDTVRGV